MAEAWAPHSCSLLVAITTYSLAYANDTSDKVEPASSAGRALEGRAIDLLTMAPSPLAGRKLVRSEALMFISFPPAAGGAPDTHGSDLCEDWTDGAVDIDAVSCSMLREDFLSLPLPPFLLEREVIRPSFRPVPAEGGGTMATFSSWATSLGTGTGYSRNSMTAAAAPQKTHDTIAHLDPKNKEHELAAWEAPSFEFGLYSTSLPASKSSKLVVLVWQSFV